MPIVLYYYLWGNALTKNFVVPADSIIQRSRSAISGSTETLRYPEEVTAHSIVFNFKEYNSNQNGRVGGGKLNTVTSGSVCLPLPKTLQDSTTNGLEQSELGLSGSATRDAYNEFRVGNKSFDFEKFGRSTSNALAQLQNASQDDLTGYALFAVKAGLDLFGNSIGRGLAVASGKAVNPHVALVFEGVPLKGYQFEWSFAPDNETEAIAIRNIINKFKKMALPTYDSVLPTATNNETLSRGLLAYPGMVDIFFTGLDVDHFPKFKTAMITEVIADYTPHGIVLHKGKNGSKPAAVNLTVSIREGEIHTSGDY